MLATVGLNGNISYGGIKLILILILIIAPRGPPDSSNSGLYPRKDPHLSNI